MRNDKSRSAFALSDDDEEHDEMDARLEGEEGSVMAGVGGRGQD